MNNADLFDHYATGYNEALSNAISVSGEAREYFAEGRVNWLKHCLREMSCAPRVLLDFGCGDGSTTPILFTVLQGDSAVGVDVSDRSLEIARERYTAAGIRYSPLKDFKASGQIDLAYCNGVFHHIPTTERIGAVARINSVLRMGGLFALWENNPWNPATRYVMSRCEFDRDAVMLTPPEVRTLLSHGGFEILRTDFRFVFPRALKYLRKLEDRLYRLPLGTQYQVLAKKIR